MHIILDEKKGPFIKDKNIYLYTIFDLLSQGKSLKDICLEFSLTQEQILVIFQYIRDILQKQTVFPPKARFATGDLKLPRHNKKEVISVYIDGAARGNPGDAGIGVVFCDEKGKVINEIKEYIGITTNNVAEYKALIKALNIVLTEFKVSKLSIFSDSELVINQILGRYKVKDENLKKLFKETQELLRKFDKVNINHIQRNKNKQADKLANMAINLK